MSVRFFLFAQTIRNGRLAETEISATLKPSRGWCDPNTDHPSSHTYFGRLAQTGESVTLTKWKSKVRVLHRSPVFSGRGSSPAGRDCLGERGAREAQTLSSRPGQFFPDGDEAQAGKSTRFVIERLRVRIPPSPPRVCRSVGMGLCLLNRCTRVRVPPDPFKVPLISRRSSSNG